jgi:hypothetical protein
MCRRGKADIFCKPETVSVILGVLEMKFFIQFEIKVPSDVPVFLIESISDLEQNDQ